MALANSELPVIQSRLLAKKLWASVGGTETGGTAMGPDPAAAPADVVKANAEFVRKAFLQVLSRWATEAELQASLEFLREQMQELAAVKPAEQAAAAGAIPAPASDPAQRARESLIHALFNHNDFVTVR